jgi:hypothetical protein
MEEATTHTRDEIPIFSKVENIMCTCMWHKLWFIAEYAYTACVHMHTKACMQVVY